MEVSSPALDKMSQDIGKISNIMDRLTEVVQYVLLLDSAFVSSVSLKVEEMLKHHPILYLYSKEERSNLSKELTSIVIDAIKKEI